MHERPILFSGPMVRAILAGQKTQTRRIVKPAPSAGVRHSPFCASGLEDGHGREIHLRYGSPGDRLWVRETWGVVSHAFNGDGDMIDWTPDRPATAIHEMPFGKGYYSGHVIYAADGPHEWAADDDGGGVPRSAWKPSIHMPRTVSRILLEIVDVRLQRLQDINETDALAEGITPQSAGGFALDDSTHYHAADPRLSFASLWESINGAGSWAADPCVWVVEFLRLTDD